MPDREAVVQRLTELSEEFRRLRAEHQAHEEELVQLHFAEIGVNAVGDRKFHVDINDRRVLTDFDIFASGFWRSMIRAPTGGITWRGTRSTSAPARRLNRSARSRAITPTRLQRRRPLQALRNMRR